MRTATRHRTISTLFIVLAGGVLLAACLDTAADPGYCGTHCTKDAGDSGSTTAPATLDAQVTHATDTLPTSIGADRAAAALVEAAYLGGLCATLLPAGVLADRVDRKRIMLVSSATGCAAYTSLAVAGATGSLTLPHLVAVALVAGVAARAVAALRLGQCARRPP